MRIVYLSGGPREKTLAALLDAGFVVDLAILNDPAKFPKVIPTLELARSKGIPVSIVQSKRDLHPELVRGTVGLSVGFGFVMPSEFLRSMKACLNVHGTLLPKYRGMTFPWLIVKGDTETGTTVHVIDEGVDTGPIILQRSFPVSP